MKALLLTNLYPYQRREDSGIFITNRLQQYRNLGVDYLAVPLAFKESGAIRFLRKILKRKEIVPLRELNGVRYEPVFLERKLFDLLTFKFFWSIFPSFVEKKVYHYAEKFSRRVAESVGNNYDVIHAHGMYLPVPAGLVARKISEVWNIPFVITLHGSDVNIYMAHKGVKDLYIETLESASKCIFVSNKLLEAAKSFGYSGKNAVVIPNGYDPEIFKPMDKNKVRKELRIHKENYKYVGFVGSLIPRKRADKLGKMFNLIAKEIPKTFFIVIGDGPLRGKVEKETKGLNIIFTGGISQKEVAKYMNAMDVMMLPSRKEGFGAVVIEAQACGTCVVGSSNGGIPEAIGFEEYVVDEGDNFEERFAQRWCEWCICDL